MLMAIFLYANLPRANDCLRRLFNSSLIPINFQKNSSSAKNCSCFDFYKSPCDINKCLPDDFACTNALENNACHPPNAPWNCTFLLGSFRLRLISGLFQRWGKSLLYIEYGGHFKLRQNTYVLLFYFAQVEIYNHFE